MSSTDEEPKMDISEEVWTHLLRSIKRGLEPGKDRGALCGVIPIVGWQVLTVEVEADEKGQTASDAEDRGDKRKVNEVPLWDLLLKETLAELDPANTSGVGPWKEMSHLEAASEWIAAGAFDSNRVSDFMESLATSWNKLRASGLKPGKSLRCLAEITGFKLFIGTTPDTLLGMAIDQARFGGYPGTLQKYFSLNANLKSQDPEPIDSMEFPHVFRIFGRMTSVPSDRMASEEDLLEFFHKFLYHSFHHQSAGNQLSNLYDALGRCDLLFIGSMFPDWLARVFLRGVRQDRLGSSDKRTREYIVGSRSREGQRLAKFLGLYAKSSTSIIDVDPNEFISELHKRWVRFQPPETLPHFKAPPSDMPPGAVFISYASQDRDAARLLATALRTRGIEVWFDSEELRSGDRWAEKICNNIRECRAFMPLYSSNTYTAESDRYFRDEWKFSCDLSERPREAPLQFFPVQIEESDQSEEWRKDLPETFGRWQHCVAPDGRIAEADLEYIVGKLTQASF